MVAYKGFNSQLQAVMGKGVMQFEAGGTYEEDKCKCARNGLHCAENPLCALTYYSSMDARYFIVEAAGDINQDGVNSRISCTKMTLVKEINRIELAVHACLYIQRYPERDAEGDHVAQDAGKCHTKGDFIIVRGKSPRAAGVKGAWLFLLREEKKSAAIRDVLPVYIDGAKYRADTWYGIRGNGVCIRKNLGT